MCTENYPNQLHTMFSFIHSDTVSYTLTNCSVVYFKHIKEIYQFGPYGHHATV
jgi:hypothetical protein